MTAVQDKGPTLGMRHMQALLIFLNITVVYISRLNIGVAVVAMTNAETTNPDFPEFDWNEKEISYILSSFYWGYVFTQFPGGALSKCFGAKITMGLATFFSAVMSALTPWCVDWGGWQAFCVIRIVQGLFQGMLFPCIHEHLAKWSPLQERNRLGALSHTGIECGTVLAMFITGIIAEGPLGWPGISYVSAGMCFAWCILWWIFSSNNATESVFISEAEKLYIESSMERSEDFHKNKIPVPWKAIILSLPFSALLVARCSEAWGLSILQAQIPSYLNGLLHMDIKNNALFSALPFLAMWAMSYVYVLIADIMQRKKIFSLTVIRKSINSVAFWLPAAGLIAIGFLDEDNKNLAIALMTLSVGVNSGATIGSSLNTIDLSPNHAGFLMGIVNTIANFMPLIAPLVVGVIVTDSSNRSQWQIVFITAAAIFFFGNVYYLIFGTSHAQPWDAEDFLVSKDLESSSNNRKDLQVSAEAAVKAIVQKEGPTLGMRHMQTLLIFLNIVVVYVSRLNIGVAVVAMTNAETTNPNFPEFDWNEREISYVISSFYWGYIFTQFPGGALSKRFGAKVTMGISTFLTAVLSAMIPWCVDWGGWQAYCAIRIAQGFFQGTLFPCIHEHLAKWSPLQERNRLGALSHTGIECGTVLAMFITGIIAEGPLGWPGISYVSAGMCFAWCILWWIFSSNNATESRFITEAEKVYIETSLQRSEDFHKTKIPVPWKAVCLSVPFCALLVVRCAEGWGLGTLQSQIPSYLNGVLNMNIKNNALYSALPFLAMWVMSYVYVLIADVLLSKKLLSLTAVRKTINSVAFWIPAVGLIAIGFLDESNETLAIALMTLNVGVNSGATIGSSLNTIDLSPNHAGFLMSIINTIANLPVLVAPLIVGVIVTDTSNRSEWQIVFILAAAIFFFGNLVYIIFGTAQSQPWDADDFLLPKDSESSLNSRGGTQKTADSSAKP